MMKSKLYLLLFCLILGKISFAQTPTVEEKLSTFQDQIGNEKLFKDKISIDHKITLGAELIFFSYNEFEILSDGYTYTFHEQPVSITIANYSIEPRFNFKEISPRKSLFLKIPLGISLSVTTNTTYRRSLGFMHAYAGAFVGIGSGLGATTTNLEQRGMAFGIGGMALRAPLFGHKIKPGYESEFLLADGSDYKARRNWFLPAIQLDLYRITKKNKFRGYNFLFGYYKTIYFKFGLTF